jgi:hypothetical protein
MRTRWRAILQHSRKYGHLLTFCEIIRTSSTRHDVLQMSTDLLFSPPVAIGSVSCTCDSCSVLLQQQSQSEKCLIAGSHRPHAHALFMRSSDVADVVHKYTGNILEGRMTVLGSEFAMVRKYHPPWPDDRMNHI